VGEEKKKGRSSQHRTAGLCHHKEKMKKESVIRLPGREKTGAWHEKEWRVRGFENIRGTWGKGKVGGGDKGEPNGKTNWKKGERRGGETTKRDDFLPQKKKNTGMSVDRTSERGEIRPQ